MDNTMEDNFLSRALRTLLIGITIVVASGYYYSKIEKKIKLGS
jgi:hypothetical protein